MIEHPMGLVLVVADGAGGSGGAVEAADALLLWVRAHVTTIADLRPASQWSDLLAKADRQMSFARGETTGVVVAVWSDGLSGASVGDSGAWLVADDGFDNLTSGQTHKPLIGTGRATPVAFERASSMAGTLLLASDGLLKYAPPGRICDLVRSSDLQAAANGLVDAVRLRSGALQDDVAAVLCRRRTTRPRPDAGRKRFTLTDDGQLREDELD